MKKHLFNIGCILALLATVALCTTSCSKDDDSNPTLDLSHAGEGFVLNVPANAANNTYDLAAAENVELTCHQPNYGGVPYVTRYFVQVAIDQKFLTDTTTAHKELKTSYTSADMMVAANEMNDSIVALFKDANPDVNYPNSPRPVYVRLRAVLDNTHSGLSYSNTITLPSVLATYVAPKATLPAQLYVMGAHVGADAWKSQMPMPQAYGLAGNYYGVFYIDGEGIKWNAGNNDNRGYSRTTAINDLAGAGVKAGDDDRIAVNKAGWYTLYMIGEIDEEANVVKYTLNILPANVYICGDAAGSWTQGDASLKCTAPATADGEFVSPAFKAAGEMRAYIDTKAGGFDGLDWWRTEFTLYKGTTLYYRDFDIPGTWMQGAKEKANKPDPENYSVACSAGQKLYVNFKLGTGIVK